MISLDWTLGLQFVNFFILLFLLNKLLYRPLLNIIAERRAAIEGSHAKAKSLEAGIEEKMRSYQQQLGEAKALANAERNALKKTAAEEEASIIASAHGNAAARLQSIKAQVADEATQASQTLKKEAASLAGQIATKILGRELV